MRPTKEALCRGGTPWCSKGYCVVVDGYTKVLMGERADGKGSTAHKQTAEQNSTKQQQKLALQSTRTTRPRPKPVETKQTDAERQPKANKQTNKQAHNTPNQTHKCTQIQMRTNERTKKETTEAINRPTNHQRSNHTQASTGHGTNHRRKQPDMGAPRRIESPYRTPRVP
jgi:hypothetical protein